MELKIDISEEDFITISRIKNTLDGDLLRINMIKAIQNGKPLPKGHGRLIDAKEGKDANSN